MLREPQHERILFNDFNTSSVRPFDKLRALSPSSKDLEEFFSTMVVLVLVTMFVYLKDVLDLWLVASLLPYLHI
jgi:hypothetical protein